MPWSRVLSAVWAARRIGRSTKKLVARIVHYQIEVVVAVLGLALE
jgi:hypothetical protein